jgi:hypothetical protein
LRKFAIAFLPTKNEMAGDALLDRGSSRLSVFSDADDLFDNQMADFSPEEEARMLTAMLCVLVFFPPSPPSIV